MERIMSQEERIRRAEEIYYRRRLNNNNVRMPSSQVSEGREKRQFVLYKKMALQILICILIYLIFSLIKDAGYLFSENVMDKTKEFLSTDINFSVLAGQVEQFWQENEDKFSFLTNSQENNNGEEQNIQGEDKQNGEATNQEENNGQAQNEVQNGQEQNNEVQNGQSSNVSTENQAGTNQTTQNQASSNQEAGIGGGSSNEAIQTSSRSGTTKTQMQLDAEYIKKNFSLVLPAKAKITSSYGKRTPTEIVSENHQGIDIGVSVGTTVVAAMEGTVSVVSTEGSYRNARKNSQ